MFKKTLAALAIGAALAAGSPPAAAQQVAQLACMTAAQSAAYIQANPTVLSLPALLQQLRIPIAQVVQPVQFCAYGSGHVYVLNILTGNQARRMVVDARTAAVVPGV